MFTCILGRHPSKHACVLERHHSKHACVLGRHHSKHAGSDPEIFWLQPVMAVTASVQQESARVVYAGSHFPHLIQFRFSLYKTDPGPIWVAWSASGLEASRCAGIIRPGFWQVATGPLPVFHFQTRSQSSADIRDHIVAVKSTRIRFSSG